MPARLVLFLPHHPVRRVLLDSARSYLVGRSSECDVCLDDSRLSRRHARLEANGDDWTIRDLDSKNGLLVDGRRVRSAALVKGAWISLGGVIGRYERLSQEALLAEEHAARERWETTQDLARQLDPELGLDRLLRQVLQSVLGLTGLERGFVLLTDEEGRMRLAARKAVSREELTTDAFTGSWGAVRMTMEARRVLVSSDVSESTALGERPSVISGRIRALACVPLEVDGQLTGLVYADSTGKSKEFTQLDVELLTSLCSQAAIAIGVARISSRLDSVRRKFDEIVADPEQAAGWLRDSLPAFKAPADEAELAQTALEGN